MSCPWAKISTPEPTNLQDIMSEEIARDLQAKEVQKYAEVVNETSPDNFEIPKEILEQVGGDICDSDAAIASMLQRQFDKEYDDMLKRTENKYNGTSKVSVSLENYRRMPSNGNIDSDPDEEDLEDLRDRKDWDRFDTVNREMAAIPPCGYRMKDGNMVTKHDVTNSARKNACKMMSFPPEFQTGDGAGFDLKLSNQVFNRLGNSQISFLFRKGTFSVFTYFQKILTFVCTSSLQLHPYKNVNIFNIVYSLSHLWPACCNIIYYFSLFNISYELLFS